MQQPRPGRLLVAVVVSRLIVGSRLMGGIGLEIVELARALVLLLTGEGAAVGGHVSDLATTEATAVGDEMGLFRRGELGGAWRVVGSVGSLGQIVDLSRQVVDSNV